MIRLRPGQNRFAEFSHPLLSNANDYKLTDEEFEGAERNAQILSRLWLVRRVVGKYLYHWPTTEIWLNEMASVGLQVLCEYDDLRLEKPLLNRLAFKIEEMLNNSRSVVRASLRTNISREAAGKELEYAEVESLYNVGEDDFDLQQSELIDELDPEDRATYLESRYDED